jgi:outer membrane protein assembly factor BamB
MKYNSSYAIRQSTIGLILSTVCLCGFFFDWINYEKQAIWTRFIGYSPEAHTSALSAFTQDTTMIIVKQTKRILAIETKSGQIRWQQKLSRYALTNPAATNPTKIFIATAEPRLLALDINTGELVWSVATPHIILAKAAADEKQVVVKTITGDVLAFNAKNGKPLWHYKHSTPSRMLYKNSASQLAPDQLFESSAPQLTTDQLFVGFPDGKLLALNRADGKLMWEHTVTQAENGTGFDKLVDISADPIIDIAKSVIYVSAYHGRLQCLSLEAGDLQWERPFSGHMPLALGKHLYGLDDNDVLYAFNKTDGSILWTQTAFKDYQATVKGYHVIGPILTEQGEQLVLADQEGNIYWVSSEDGSLIEKASFNTTSPILTLPLTQNNTVYAMNRFSQIAAWKNPPMPRVSAIGEQPIQTPTPKSTTETSSTVEKEVLGNKTQAIV